MNTNTLQTHHAQTEAIPWFQRTIYSYNLLYHSYRPKRNISRIYNSIPKHLTSFSSIHGKTRVPLVHKPVKAWRGNGRTQQKIKKPLPVALGMASSRCDTSAPASPTASPSQEEFGIWYRARSKTQLNKDLTAFAHLHEVCLGLMIFTQLPARAARRTRG